MLSMVRLTTLFDKTKIIFSTLQNILKQTYLLLHVLWIRIYYGKQTVLCCVANLASIGGNELQFLLTSSGLKERGLTQVAIMIGHVIVDNHSIHQICKRGIIPLSFGHLCNVQDNFISTIFRILGADIIKVFNPASAILILPAKRAGMRVIYVETGIPLSNDPFWQPLKPYIKDLDFVISVSKCGLIQLQTEFGYQGPSKVIPSLIEPPPANCFARDPEVNQCRIIYFGRLCPTKQIDNLVKAFACVHAIFPFVRLTIIGEGEMRDALQNEVRELNITEYVHWSGWLSREHLFQELATADIFCLPSKSEGSPCSIAEAMSIGLAVIATNVGGIPETVTHQKTGLLVPVNNIQALAEAMLELIKHPNLRLELGKEGYHQYHLRRNEQQVFSELLDIYQNRY